MSQFHPSQRLDLADILGHDWFNGPIATTEEVQAEFRRRHEQILVDRQAEEQRKQQARAARGAGGVARDLGDGDLDVQKLKLGTWS